MKAIILLIASLFLPEASLAGGNGSFLSICYHDVRDDISGHLDKDQFAVSTDNLIAHFSWLREHGYTIVSIDDILSAREGHSSLPDKAVLITFDDGYKGVYTIAFPVLKMFNYPAVIAIVGSWMDVEQGSTVLYGKQVVSRDKFITWQEGREMLASGLIEFASHSYDLHKGIKGNPQGNEQAAAITRLFMGGRYETESAYQKRLLSDLLDSTGAIEKNLGVKPRVMVWPYGKYNSFTLKASRSAGMPITLSLDDVPNQLDKLFNISRILIEGNPAIAEFVAQLEHIKAIEPVRAIQVDLDDIYNEDIAIQRRNLDFLLDQVKYLAISHVFLKAYSDDNNDGKADSLYFANRRLPVKRDLFNRVAWQLTTRSEVEVFAVMPIYDFEFDSRGLIPDHYKFIQNDRSDNRHISDANSNTPDSEQIIKTIFEDLAAYNHFNGILLQDDTEDVTAKEAPNSFALILVNQIRKYRPTAKSARMLDTTIERMLENTRSISQMVRSDIAPYDYAVLSMSPTEEDFRRMKKLIRVFPGIVSKIIVSISAPIDAQNNSMPMAEITTQMRNLQAQGIVNIAYVPGVIMGNEKTFKAIREGISLGDHPGGR